jgi:hypothetical protein
VSTWSHHLCPKALFICSISPISSLFQHHVSYFQGKRGKQGPPGDFGPKGEKGPSGSDGRSGLKGPKGERGNAGYGGRKGPQGDPVGKPFEETLLVGSIVLFCLVHI